MASQADLIEQLAQNIERIRDNGISYGLSDLEIDYCIQQVFLKSSQKEKKKARKPRSICGTICVWWFRLSVVVFGAVAVLLAVSAFHSPTDRVISQVTAPLTYPFFRYLRILTLPLSTRIDLTKFYDMPCMILNPMYEDEPPDCAACSNTRTVPILKNITVDTFKRRYVEHWQFRPIIVQGEVESEVTFNDLKSIYIENQPKLITAPGRFESSDHGIGSPDAFFMSTTEQHILNTKNFQARWTSIKMSTSQVFRSAFARPHFLPLSSEVDLQKTIIIENCKMRTYKLPEGRALPHVWYVQGSGSRELVFRPHPGCEKSCKSFKYVAHPTDMVFYMENYWRVESRPVNHDEKSATENGEDKKANEENKDPEICISFTGYFS